MKKVVLLLTVAILAISCKKEQDDDPFGGGKGITPQNYFSAYFSGEMSLFAHPLKGTDQTSLIEVNFEGDTFYYPTMEPFPGCIEKYNEIAKRNGDTDFNREIAYAQYISNIALAYNYKSVHAVSDAPWDETHPAGANLDNILEFHTVSYSDFIRSGYEKRTHNDGIADDDYRCVAQRMDKLTANDIEILQVNLRSAPIEIYFLSAPTLSEEHTITITMITTEGEVQTASVKCKPAAKQ